MKTNKKTLYSTDKFDVTLYAAEGTVVFTYHGETVDSAYVVTNGYLVYLYNHIDEVSMAIEFCLNFLDSHCCGDYFNGKRTYTEHGYRVWNIENLLAPYGVRPRNITTLADVIETTAKDPYRMVSEVAQTASETAGEQESTEPFSLNEEALNILF